MRTIIRRMLLIMTSVSMMLFVGCMDLEESSSKSSSTAQTTTAYVQKVSQEVTTEEDQVYGDPELRIIYPRPTGNPLIKKGSSGDDVGWVQAALNKAMKTSIAEDCSFGAGTESSVISFQSRCGLQADGVVGPQTLNELVEIIKGNKELPAVIIPITTSPPENNSGGGGLKFDPPEKSLSNSYVLNTNTKKFHKPSCSSVSKMKAENKSEYWGSRDDVIGMGYSPCQKCNP